MAILSLGNTTLINASALDVLPAAAAGGFDAAGLRIAGRKPEDIDGRVMGNSALIRDINLQRDTFGIQITHVTGYAVTLDLSLDHFLPFIETAAALGAGMIVVNCGMSDETRFVGFMQEYCDAAAPYGIKLVLEFIPYSQAKTIQQGARMVSRCARPNFGLMVDALQLARGGGTPVDVAAANPNYLAVAQLCDAAREKPPQLELRQEALTRRLYPGDGELPLYEFLDALPADIQIDVEVPCPMHAGLTPTEQAKLVGRKCRAFLETYHRARGTK